jgi:hypothetical protein
MDDWEQPNTTALRRSQPSSGGDGASESLQQQLAAAVDRIAMLEERVQQLEARVASA